MIELLRNERPDEIAITLAPFYNDQRVFASATEIDRAMIHRMQGKKLFKVGQSERVVYEKVAGLKRTNGLLSILYNFSSEGAYSDLEMPVRLLGATADQT